MRHRLLDDHDGSLAEPEVEQFLAAFRASSPMVERLRSAGLIRHAKDADGKELTWRWEIVPEEER